MRDRRRLQADAAEAALMGAAGCASKAGFKALQDYLDALRKG